MMFNFVYATNRQEIETRNIKYYVEMQYLSIEQKKS